MSGVSSDTRKAGPARRTGTASAARGGQRIGAGQGIGGRTSRSDRHGFATATWTLLLALAAACAIFAGRDVLLPQGGFLRAGGAPNADESLSQDEPLADVRVEGNVTIPASTILRYVRSIPGRPPVERQIREDVAALHRTRWFFSVEPRIRQTPQGAVLIIKVLERPVVRSIEYAGAAAKNVKHLQALTGLKEGSPYDPSANRESARRIEDWYHEKGYTFATVELEQGAEPQGRDVVFRIAEGAKCRVTGIRFAGNEFFSGALLKTKVQTKTAILWVLGGLYDPASIPNDVAALKAYYHSVGFFDVKIGHDVEFNADRSHATILYTIEEGARYRIRRIEVDGNEIFATPDLVADMKVKAGEYFNERLVNKDSAAIKDRYGKLGHLFAEVRPTPRFLDTPGEADLVFKIDEDQPYVIRRINVHIEGDNPHTRRQVALNNAVIAPGDFADPKLIERTKSRIGGTQVFDNTPGMAPRVSITRVPPDETAAVLQTVFRGQDAAPGHPGPRDATRASLPRNAAPDPRNAARGHAVGPIRGSAPSPRAAVHPIAAPVSRPPVVRSSVPAPRTAAVSTATPLRFAEDDVVDEPPASASGLDDIRPLTGFAPGFWDEAGALDAPVRHYEAGKPVAPQPLSVPTQDPGGDSRAADDGAIVRGQSEELGIPVPQTPLYDNSPLGDPFTPGRRAPPPGLVDVDIYANEARTGRLMFGVGVNSDAGVVGQIVLDESNFDILRPPTSFRDIWAGNAFRGGGQRFRLEAVPGSQVSQYRVSWSDPFFLDTNYSLGVSGFYYNRFFPAWDEQRLGGRVSVGRQFTPAFSMALALRLEDVQITNPKFPTPAILQESVGDNFLETVRVSAAHDTRDSAFLPGEGHYVQLAYEQAFGEFLYPRFEAEARQFFTLYSRPDGGGRHILSLNGQLGWTDDGTPIFERFYAGGFQTFRGFQFRGVTPTELGIGVGGQWMALGSVEYLMPVTADETFRAVAFTDFGTVQNDVSFSEFRVTAGFGLRITVPAMGPVPLAFDFAFPVTRQDTDITQVFSFYLGVTR